MDLKLWNHFRSKEAFKEGVTAVIKEGSVEQLRKLLNPSEFLEENWDIAMSLAFDAAVDNNKADLILAVLNEAGGSFAQQTLVAGHHYAAFCLAAVKGHKEAIMVLLAYMDDAMINKAIGALKDRHDIGKTQEVTATLERGLNNPSSSLRKEISAYKKTLGL